MEIEVPSRVAARFHERYEVTESGCWLWTRATNGVGYGRLSWQEGGVQRWHLAHRVSFVLANGSIPEGMDIDHLCHDPATCRETGDACPHRRCVNPDHLRPVRTRENLLRGGGTASLRRAVRECPQGHPYDESNTYVDKQGRRSCRECTRQKNREYYHRNRERRSAYNRAWRERRAQQASGGA